MKQLLFYISLFLLTQTTNAAPPAKALTAKQLITIFINTPTKDFKSSVTKLGFTFNKQTPVPTYQSGQKGNIKDAYRLYFKQGANTLMLQVLKTDKTNMIYHLSDPAQLKAITAQVKKMKLEKRYEMGTESLYQIKKNYGIYLSGKGNTVELKNVVYFMDIEEM